MAIEMLTNAHNLLIIIYAVWRRSSVGQSIRFIPVGSLVRIQSPLPNFFHGPLAQLVEHPTLNRRVTGSSPVWPTIFLSAFSALSNSTFSLNFPSQRQIP